VQAEDGEVGILPARVLAPDLNEHSPALAVGKAVEHFLERGVGHRAA
jgi:hypothetical protein